MKQNRRNRVMGKQNSNIHMLHSWFLFSYRNVILQQLLHCRPLSYNERLLRLVMVSELDPNKKQHFGSFTRKFSTLGNLMPTHHLGPKLLSSIAQKPSVP